ncbi:MAG: UUP1 family membrane protein [Opitutales bacterium]|nr:UUP1 family membrane protein [Opitutales bacterium]
MSKALKVIRQRRFSPRLQVWVLALLLTAVGLGLAIHKHRSYGFPLSPRSAETVWTIEAEISFQADGRPVRATLALPSGSPEFQRIDESFSSLGYGFFRTVGADGRERAEWTKREADGSQRLYYRTQIVRRPSAEAAAMRERELSILPVSDPAPFWESADRLAVDEVLDRVRRISADTESFAMQLVRLLRNGQDDQSVSLLLSRYSAEDRRSRLVLDLLRTEGIPTRLIRGVYLADGRRFQPVVEGIEVYHDQRWVFIDPLTGNPGVPEFFFRWQRGGQSLLDLEGGRGSQVRFSVLRDTRPAETLAFQRLEEQDHALLDYSIYSLPIEDQNVFKRLLLIPFGALVIVLLRNIVGIPTSGTFMPILIAMAFQETRLLPGLLLFLVVVGAGLGIRSLLSHLNLLVVPRISAVVIVVILLMAGMSIVSHHMNLAEGLKVTFFPMIIIAWTIERLSILWEEEGGEAALIQMSGSLFVAVAAFLVMSAAEIRHLTYTFPELLLVVLAVILLLGQYSGYRLTELRRFQSFLPKS